MVIGWLFVRRLTYSNFPVDRFSFCCVAQRLREAIFLDLNCEFMNELSFYFCRLLVVWPAGLSLFLIQIIEVHNLVQHNISNEYIS